MWGEIAETLIEHGHNYYPDQCEQKFRGMITSLRKTISHNESIGPGEQRKTCYCYEDLLRINSKLANTREKYVKGGKRKRLKKREDPRKPVHRIVDTGQDKRFDILRKMADKRHREKIEMMEVLRN